MNVLDILVGTLTGIISGFGIGGGTILVVYLTAISGFAQNEARGINLLYFITCAPAALIGHIKNHYVQWRVAIYCTIGGIATAIPVSLVAAAINDDWLHRLFGLMLLYVGIKELRYKSYENNR